MNEMSFHSHGDANADAVSMNRNHELPMKSILSSEIPYDKVLNAMRNQEMLFYAARVRSGY